MFGVKREPKKKKNANVRVDIALGNNNLRKKQEM